MLRDNLRIYLCSSSPVFRNWIESSLQVSGLRVFAKLRSEQEVQILDKNFFNCFISSEGVVPEGYDRSIHVPTRLGLEEMKFGIHAYILSQLPEYWHLFSSAFQVPPSQTMVFLGVSTGGPVALEKLLPKIQLTPQSIYVIAQHMPAGQTRGLVDHLSRRGLKIGEASHNEALLPGKWYVLPSGVQSFLSVDQKNRPLFFQSTGPESLHKPLIDYSLYSVALAYRRNLIAGILTGMGSDGALALKAAKDLGAITFAESRESALVFGMPKAALEYGATSNELNLTDMPDFIHHWVSLPRGNSDVA